MKTLQLILIGGPYANNLEGYRRYIVLAALKSEASGAAITLATDAPVGVGQTTIVDLLISDVGDAMAPSLGAYDITITFDASLLGFASAAFGDPVLGNQLDLTGLGSLHGDDPGLGNVNLFEVSLNPPDLLNSTQAGAFVLARLTLIGLSEGTSFTRCPRQPPRVTPKADL